MKLRAYSLLKSQQCSVSTNTTSLSGARRDSSYAFGFIRSPSSLTGKAKVFGSPPTHLKLSQIMLRSLPLCVEHKYTLFCDVVWSYTVLYQNHRESDVRGTKPEFQVCFVFLFTNGEKKNICFFFHLCCFVSFLTCCSFATISKWNSKAEGEKHTGNCFTEILIFIAQKLVMATHSLELSIVHKLCDFILVTNCSDKFIFSLHILWTFLCFFITIAPCYLLLSLGSNRSFHLLFFFPMH